MKIMIFADFPTLRGTFFDKIWENKKIAGANFCTDRQTIAIFR